MFPLYVPDFFFHAEREPDKSYMINHVVYFDLKSVKLVLGKNPPGKKPPDSKPDPIPNLTLILPRTPHGGLFSGGILP